MTDRDSCTSSPRPFAAGFGLTLALFMVPACHDSGSERRAQTAASYAPAPAPASPRAAEDARRDPAPAPPAVLRVGFTVSNLERSVKAFEALDFRLLEQYELEGSALEALFDLGGVRARVAELALGDEAVELTECRGVTGRAIPRDSRGNDVWFQHMAIVVRDMDSAFGRVAPSFAEPGGAFSALSPAPQTIPLTETRRGRHPRRLLEDLYRLSAVYPLLVLAIGGAALRLGERERAIPRASSIYVDAMRGSGVPPA